MIIGTAYYPEHWDKNRWKQDAALMQEMGINTVRMGEFGWSVVECREKIYDFSMYDEAISLLAEHGIATILGTPTATPPAWLCQKYPDIFMEDKRGVKRGFGSRRHYCYNHRGYQQCTEIIVSAMVEHYRNNPHVIAWQIDNELGCEDEARCYCEGCRKAFIDWLLDKYKSLAVLNENWGTVFWSQTYTEWEQIGLPRETVVDGYTGNGHNPGLLLDYARFSSDSLINYAKIQCNILRRFTDKPMIHNTVSEFCDNYKLSSILDGAGYDAYPRSEWDHNSPGRIGFHYDLTRGYSKSPFWILEQQSGPCGWNILGETPQENELKLWSIQGVARGAKALIYFRWRTCVFGTEQFWYGILDHDGIPRRRYRELKEAVSEIQKYDAIFQYPNQKKFLLVYDYENKFCHDFQPHIKGFNYKEETIHYYEALTRLHLPVDVGGINSDFQGYKIVLLPFCSILKKDVLLNFEAYVKNGGVLILTPFSGLREENNRITTETLPGVFRELAGVTVEEFCIHLEENAAVRGIGTAGPWCERLALTTARSIADYAAYGNSSAAVTVNAYGKGRVYYIASLYEKYDNVLEKICARENLTGLDLPPDIECIIKKDGNYIILLNHSSQEEQISIGGYQALNHSESMISLPGFSYVILKSI